MDEFDDLVIIDYNSIPGPPVGSATGDLSTSKMAVPFRNKPSEEKPVSDVKSSSPVLIPQHPEEACSQSEEKELCDKSFQAYEDDKSVNEDEKSGEDKGPKSEEEGKEDLKRSEFSGSSVSRYRQQNDSAESSRVSESPAQLDDSHFQDDERPPSPRRSSYSPPPPPRCHREGSWDAPPPPPPPPPPPIIFQNPPPPPPPFHRGPIHRPIAGAYPPPPPPPPPPPMSFWDPPSPACVPPPPPPPPINMSGPAARKRRGGVNELEIVESASDLRSRIAYDNGSNTHTQPLERVVRLPVGGPARRAALTHHAATPFDLHTYLWLLRHGEPDRWYTRPSDAQLHFFRQLEAAHLGSEIATLLDATCTANARPAPADIVRIAAGEVMGLAGPIADVDDDAFLAFYMVVEAPRAPPDDRADAFSPYPPGPRAPAGCRGEDRVYKIERVGSSAAAAAAAYHNAALRGWSTVFCCAVMGEAQWAHAHGAGLRGFERVRGVGALVGGEMEEVGVLRVWY